MQNALKKLSWKSTIAILAGLFILLYPMLGASAYMKHLFILFFIWSIVAASWNLLMGYAGINSLGNVGFMAIGGYTSVSWPRAWGFPPGSAS